MELIIVLIIVTVAAAYWIRRLQRTFNKDTTSGCGCDCACSGDKACEATDQKSLQILK